MEDEPHSGQPINTLNGDSGRSNMEGEPHSGRLTDTLNRDSIACGHYLLQEDPQYTVSKGASTRTAIWSYNFVQQGCAT